MRRFRAYRNINEFTIIEAESSMLAQKRYMDQYFEIPYLLEEVNGNDQVISPDGWDYKNGDYTQNEE